MKKRIIISIVIIIIIMSGSFLWMQYKPTYEKKGFLLDILQISKDEIETIRIAYKDQYILIKDKEEIEDIIPIINFNVIFNSRHKEERDGWTWSVDITTKKQEFISYSLFEDYVRWRGKKWTYVYDIQQDINWEALHELFDIQ